MPQVDLLFPGFSLPLMMKISWEKSGENKSNVYKKKIWQIFMKCLHFHVIVCLFFLLLLFLSLSTPWNGFGKDPRNNRSIKSGLRIEWCHLIAFSGIFTNSRICGKIRTLHAFLHVFCDPNSKSSLFYLKKKKENFSWNVYISISIVCLFFFLLFLSLWNGFRKDKKHFFRHFVTRILNRVYWITDCCL